MEQLRFTAVHEDGQHLVLSTADGTELLLPVDARLRAALRTRTAPADAPATPLSPRNVQAMIRAGQSPEEVAEITGWPAERVARFEGPILAEREHVSGMARGAHVRGRAPEGGVATLGSRVLERLAERGVDTDNVGWDATRPEGGTWTVVVSFVAGQRQRAAAWHFDPMDRTVEALDDEARWLSEDEQALPGGAVGGPPRSGGSTKPLLSSRTSAGEVELMTSMRERSRSRGRRKKASTSTSDPAGLPQLEHAPEDVLPLEDLAYDPDTMGLPPAAHGDSPAPDVAAEPAPDDDALAGETSVAARPADAVPDDDVSDDVAETPDSEGTHDEVTDDKVTGVAASRDGGPSGYDVPLQFDNDQDETPDDSEPDLSPREATLDDLFGPEDDEDDEDQPDEDSTAADLTHADEPDKDQPDEDDVEVELGEEPIAEDAAELGGDLDDSAVADSPAAADADSPSAPGADEDAVEDSPEAATQTTASSGPETASGTEAGSEPKAADAAQDAEPKKPAAKPKPTRRKDGRPGVPSWDDIMFGAADRKR